MVTVLSRRVAGIALLGWVAGGCAADDSQAVGAGDTGGSDVGRADTETDVSTPPDAADPDTGGGTDTTDAPDVALPDAGDGGTGPVDAGGTCGDGRVGDGEACDPSAPLTGCGAGFVCEADCSACVPRPTACGDGAVSGDEVCDGSASNDGCGGGQVCNDTCSACVASGEPFCGDGARNGDEACDGTATGNTGCARGFECNPTCTACRPVAEPECGDGSVNGTEVCDGSATLNSGCPAPSVCNTTCTACEAPAPVTCGDGARGPDEVCDGSAIGDVGCAPRERCASNCLSCLPPLPACGDGEVNGAETCDRSAAVSGCGAGEQCSADCAACEPLPEACGNGAVDDGETCDPGDGVSVGCGVGEVCTEDCSLCRPVGCGDGAVGGAEVCDGSAAVTGCDEGAVCSSSCDACSVCGDYEITGDEECDYDGIFGDGDTCPEGTICASCRCVPERIRLVSGEAAGSEIDGVLSLRIEIDDRSGFASFALLFLDEEGAIVDFFRGGARDLLLESRRTPEDDPRNYTWVVTTHFLLGAPEDARFLYLVLFDEEGVPSNPLFGEVPGIFTPRPVGAACFPDMYVTGCAGGGLCPEPGRVCGATDASLVASSLGGELVGDDGVRFAFEVLDDQGDMLPYWLLAVYDRDLDLMGVAFRPFDGEWTDGGGGTWRNTLTIDSVGTNTGIPFADIGAFSGIIYDRSGFDILDPVFNE